MTNQITINPEQKLLSAKEANTVLLLAQDHSKPQIASRLHRSISTIKSHVANSGAKLGVMTTATGIVGAAFAQGVLEIKQVPPMALLFICLSAFGGYRAPKPKSVPRRLPVPELNIPHIRQEVAA